MLLLCSSLVLNAQTSYNVKVKNAYLRDFYDKKIFLKNLTIRELQPLCKDFFPSEQKVCHWFTLTFAEKDSSQILANLRKTPYFSYVELNRKTSADTFFFPKSLPVNYHHTLIKTPQAHKKTQGNKKIVIGIIDTGIDYNHPELKHALAINPAEDLNGNGTFEPWKHTETKNGITGDLNGIDDDGNGYADDVLGYDFTHQPELLGGGDYLFYDPDPYDDNSHGTIVASIIAANKNDGNALYGIAPDCSLKILRAFAANGTAEDDDIARAIIYATRNQVKILNCSFGDIYPSQMMHDAIKYAYSQGIIIVASAGNGTGDNPHYPSDFPEVISVTASDYDPDSKQEYLWTLSSYGLFTDLCAPGSQIYVTLPTDSAGNVSYDFVSGTSASAPMISAAAGLLLALDSSLSNENIRSILNATADDIMDNGWDIFTGNGRLNLEKALQFAYGGKIKIYEPFFAGNTLKVPFSCVAPMFVSYKFSYFLQENPSVITPITPEIFSQTLKDTLDLNITGLSQGNYLIRLEVLLANNKKIVVHKPFVLDFSPPKHNISVLHSAWDLNEKKLLLLGKTDDKAKHSLKVNSQVHTFDKIGKRFQFLVSPSQNNNTLQLSSQNLAGIKKDTTFFNVSFAQKYISTTGIDTFAGLPNGYFLPPEDLDNDGNLEIVCSEFDSLLRFGKIVTYSYNNGTWLKRNEIPGFSALIPKTIYDFDKDGTLDLLCSSYDSLFFFEWKNNAWNFKFSKNYNKFPAGIYDINKDGNAELWLKDSKDYYVFTWNGNDFIPTDTLPDPTNDYVGATAPHIETADLDSDGKPEVFIKDYDGDLWIYEYENNKFQLKKVLEDSLVSGTVLFAVGNLDNDNAPELVSVSLSSYLRDEEDFENEPKYAKIEILEANGNDNFQIVFKDFIWNYNSLKFNACATTNIDNDPEEEILIGIFPKFYVFDYNNLSWQPRWFAYGIISSSISAGDFDKDGKEEFLLGYGDSAYVHKINSYYDLQEPAYLEAELLAKDSIRLSWSNVPGAVKYNVYKTNYGNTTLFLAGTSTTTRWNEGNLPLNDTLVYSVTAVNSNNQESKLAYPVLVKTGNLPKIHSVIPVSPTILRVCISSKINPYALLPTFFVVNDSVFPASVLEEGDSCVLLMFSDTLTAGILCIDSLFKDFFNARLDTPNCRAFSYISPGSSYVLYLKNSEKINEKEGRLRFNVCLDPATVSPDALEVSPYGKIVEVRLENPKELRFRLDKAVLGATGQPIIVRVKNLQGCNGEKVKRGEGDTAIFIEKGKNLTEVYVYPNPVKKNSYYEGVRFANLFEGVGITVYTETGFPIQELQASDDYGGIFWDLRDKAGNKLIPGVYVFKVFYEGKVYKIGKFAILE